MTTEDQSTEMPGTDEFWEKDEGVQNLDFGAAELQQLQHSDESLAEIWQLLKNGHLEWVEKYSLIYRVKGQLGKEEEAERRKQLVLNAEKQFSRWPTKFQWRDTWEKAGVLRGCCSGSTGQTFTKMWPISARTVPGVRRPTTEEDSQSPLFHYLSCWSLSHV